MCIRDSYQPLVNGIRSRPNLKINALFCDSLPGFGQPQCPRPAAAGQHEKRNTAVAYPGDDSAPTFATLPWHPAITSAHRGGEPAPGDALFTLDRVIRLDPHAID